MSKIERIAMLEIKCAELELRLSTSESHVTALLAAAARAKAPPQPPVAWTGGEHPYLAKQKDK